MHRPREPHYTFTIPSVHDDTILNCRIYHPDFDDELAKDETHSSWKRRGIVMAHPYAPMGGSYDDRVVGMIMDQFLKAGWIVGTFNFRGAPGSQSHTSWSGKPELDDFTSFAACFMYYMYYIRTELMMIPISPPSHSAEVQYDKGVKEQNQESSVIILGGYSYGSLILKHLPPVPTILRPFTNPLPGSAAEEVVLRAQKLADQTNLEWTNKVRDDAQARKRNKKSHDTKPSLTMGGEETSPDKRRTSRDIRRSIEGSTSLKIKTRLRSLSHRRREDGRPSTPPPEGHSTTSTTSSSSSNITTTILPQIRYLLISPLTGPICTLAAPGLSHKFFWHKTRESETQEVIAKHPMLAIYGDQDMFSAAKKVREWIERLKSVSRSSSASSHVSSVEVIGAGHFWHEEGAEEELRGALVEWERTIR